DARGISANRVTQHHDHHNTMTTTKAADTKPVQQQQHTQPVWTSYTQPAPQKIPTYEQPQPSEYGEPPVTHTDGGPTAARRLCWLAGH
ncbi:hypothetical protein K443DRAFT_686300, partial [Laccaria amethystina LaAM-08-1]